MHNVFAVVQIAQCQVHNRTGVLQLQVDAGGNPITDASGNQVPLMENYVQIIGSIFDIWHNLDKLEVLTSCQTFFQHSKDVDCQNLSWSYELLMKNVNPSLKQHVISSCEIFPEYAFSGPFAFYIIAERIMSTMQNLAHNVNSGLLVMSLRNFEGKDVMKCMFILRNVLCFLNYGIAGFNCTPPMLMDHLFDIFMTASNMQFCNYVQNLKDCHCLRTNAPESLFLQVQD